MSTAALKKSTVLNSGVLEKAEAGRARNAVQTQSTPQISSNPFHQAMFTPGQDPQARRAVVAKLLTSTGDRAQDRANIKAYEDFREWLAEQGTMLAQQIIALTNVNTMAELQSVIKEMNSDLLAFEDQMNPLMEIIDAVYQIRSQGGPDSITDAFEEIEKDRAEQERIAAEIARKEQEIRDAEDEARRLANENISLAARKTLFGFGTTPASAREQIARNEARIAEINGQKDGRKAEIDALRVSRPESKLGELAPYKEKLAELLNMTADENRGKLIGLRDAASSFINTSQARTGSLREQFLDMREQIGRVEDNNYGMTRTYAILVEAMTDAEKANANIREELAVAAENEDTITETVRKEKLTNLDDHATTLKRSQADTVATHAELAQQRVRVTTMKTAADDQIETARKLNTQGVAATADRLSMVLTAISGAALNESAAVATMTLDRMRRSTNTVTQSEVINAAMGIGKINDQLETVMAELSEISEIQRHATDIARTNMADIQTNMAKLQEQAAEVRAQVEERAGLASAINAPAQPAQQGQTGQPAGNVFDQI